MQYLHKCRLTAVQYANSWASHMRSVCRSRRKAGGSFLAILEQMSFLLSSARPSLPTQASPLSVLLPQAHPFHPPLRYLHNTASPHFFPFRTPPLALLLQGRLQLPIRSIEHTTGVHTKETSEASCCVSWRLKADGSGGLHTEAYWVSGEHSEEISARRGGCFVHRSTPYNIGYIGRR